MTRLEKMAETTLSIEVVIGLHVTLTTLMSRIECHEPGVVGADDKLDVAMASAGAVLVP